MVMMSNEVKEELEYKEEHSDGDGDGLAAGGEDQT